MPQIPPTWLLTWSRHGNSSCTCRWWRPYHRINGHFSPLLARGLNPQIPRALSRRAASLSCLSHLFFCVPPASPSNQPFQYHVSSRPICVFLSFPPSWTSRFPSGPFHRAPRGKSCFHNFFPYWNVTCCPGPPGALATVGKTGSAGVSQDRRQTAPISVAFPVSVGFPVVSVQEKQSAALRDVLDGLAEVSNFIKPRLLNTRSFPTQMLF